jgi:uncharacterized PurR-regulated membrane protein YhhQ (DUF165 family)
MNIRLKAGLEIVGFVASALFIGAVMRLALDYLSGIYGSDQVVQGLCTVVAVGFMALLLKTMYDIRVAQLGYENKLKEMIKK